MEKNRFKIVFFLLLFFQLKIIRAGDYIKSDCLLFDFYTSKWVNSPNEITTNPTVNFSFSYGKDFLIKSSNFSWFYGLGYDFSAMNHSINFKSLPSISGMSKDVGIRILNVPLEFRYRTQTKSQFRLYLGFKAGYMVRSFYLLQEDRKDIYFRKNLSELENLKYGMTFRLGYGMINLYAYYDLNGLLSSQLQKSINQLFFGVTLMAN